MLGKISEWWELRKAKKTLEGHPILGPALAHAREVLSDSSQGLGKHFSETGRMNLIGSLMEQVTGVISSPDPIQENRKKISDIGFELAHYEVLVLDKNTGWYGLVGKFGITGKLKNHLLELSEKHEVVKGMADTVTEDGSPLTNQELRDMIITKTWILHLFLQSYNIVRLGLGDYIKDPNEAKSQPSKATDWYKPFLISMYIRAEYNYWEALGLETEIKQDRSLTHMLWCSIIDNRHENLRQTWENTWWAIHQEPSPYAEVDLSVVG